ncbi:unnamed protein product [Macrosiphum euphorbiae]|uniref:Receptor ligand binding region domain-containing protein n=1 Tax=Macrosiphum euphorbiae TaxID=13131 RepID=A0AAV0VQY2_9HEMI|nr:unnamed protein product [Macrosiphum euphorbiae]
MKSPRYSVRPSATDDKSIHANMGALIWVLVGAVVFVECVTSTAVPGVVRFAVIAPLKSSKSEETLGAILPSVDLAAQAIAQPKGSLPGWKILIESRNGNCSSTDGPLAAFDLHTNSDLFLGPVCDYVIAPVARYAGVWKIPVLTAGGLVKNFDDREEYPTLTRMMGSYKLVGEAFLHILHRFGWNVVGMLYYNHGIKSLHVGNSKCFFTLSAVYIALGMKPIYKSFYDTDGRESFKTLLTEMSRTARIMVVCANPLTVREIMLAADELNMIDSGEYVFFNIELELFSSLNNGSLMPWYVGNDTAERNERAKNAYSALLTVTAREPNHEAYRNFSVEVKRVAEEKYNYTFGNESVSTFVTAFYDAVLLYGLALNETLARGGNQSDGMAIVKAMWNKTFTGITGDVNIDSNGDRIADYSLLDMDPETHKFKIVANYIGKNQSLEYVSGMSIHWAGGRTSPPLDKPECGFDNSLCETIPGYAILSIVLSSVVVILAIASALIYRHYKLEAEIASMTWKVNYNDIIRVPQEKWRTSMASLIRRNSQRTVISDDLMSLMSQCDYGRQIFIQTAFYKVST